MRAVRRLAHVIAALLAVPADFRDQLDVERIARPPRDPGQPNFLQKKRQQRRAQADARKRRLTADTAG